MHRKIIRPTIYGDIIEEDGIVTKLDTDEVSLLSPDGTIETVINVENDGTTDFNGAGNYQFDAPIETLGCVATTAGAAAQVSLLNTDIPAEEAKILYDSKGGGEGTVAITSGSSGAGKIQVNANSTTITAATGVASQSLSLQNGNSQHCTITLNGPDATLSATGSWRLGTLPIATNTGISANTATWSYIDGAGSTYTIDAPIYLCKCGNVVVCEIGEFAPDLTGEANPGYFSTVISSTYRNNTPTPLEIPILVYVSGTAQMGKVMMYSNGTMNIFATLNAQSFAAGVATHEIRSSSFSWIN